MTQIKILIQGYVREKNGEEFASSTTTLIQERGVNIIVDPGMNRGKLVKALKKEKISPQDVDFVFLTHCHLDHVLLAGMFEKAKILDGDDIYSFKGEIKSHQGRIPGTNVEIIKTPGHSLSHASLLVKTEKYGLVAAAGDVFWWSDKQKQKIGKKSLLKHPDPYQQDKKALIKSRGKILKVAEYIIPGHGKMFKNPLLKHC